VLKRKKQAAFENFQILMIQNMLCAENHSVLFCSNFHRFKLFLLQIKTKHFSCNTQIYTISISFLQNYYYYYYYCNNTSSTVLHSHTLSCHFFPLKCFKLKLHIQVSNIISCFTFTKLNLLITLTACTL